MSTSDLQCTQCGNVAMFRVGGHPLCLSCTERVDAKQEADFSRSAAVQNMLAERLDAMMPIGGVRMPRVNIPSRPRAVPIKMEQVFVQNSVVGSINSGTIQKLDVSLKDVRLADTNAGKALEELLREVQNEASLSVEARRESLELLSAIAEQLTRPKEQQEPTIIRLIAKRANELLTVSDRLASVWSAFCATVGLAQFLG